MENRERTCCFTGHRIIRRDAIEQLHARLNRTVDGLIKAGITNFLTGGALGFDTLAALTILDKRELYPHIRLILCLPCPDQSRNWTQRDKEIYEYILSKADETVILNDKYTQSCMHERNRFMIDSSNYCVAYCLDPQAIKGGSAYTLRYAHSQNVRTINLAL